MDKHTDVTTNFLIYKLNLLIKNNYQKQLKEFDITTEQWQVLKSLYLNDQCNQKELAKICFKDQAALTRILDILEKKELVKREKSQNDRREFLIVLTSEGEELAEKTMALISEEIKRMYSGFTDEEENALKSLLKKLVDNLE